MHSRALCNVGSRRKYSCFGQVSYAGNHAISGIFFFWSTTCKSPANFRLRGSCMWLRCSGRIYTQLFLPPAAPLPQIFYGRYSQQATYLRRRRGAGARQDGCLLGAAQHHTGMTTHLRRRRAQSPARASRLRVAVVGSGTSVTLPSATVRYAFSLSPVFVLMVTKPVVMPEASKVPEPV